MNEYKYNKVPITPSIIEYLIIKFFNGKIVKREIIVNKVLSYHLENEGLPNEGSDFRSSVKKALSNMMKKGYATKKSYGYWEIHEKNSPEIELNEEKTDDITDMEKVSTHIVYGKGTSAIYLYYFDSYKNLALVHNSNVWPCKLGRTDRDPITRILSQASTALPEMPTIEYIIETDEASLLETMLHSILKVQGKQIKEAPGQEWFRTNPDEIIEIIKFVDRKLLD